MIAYHEALPKEFPTVRKYRIERCKVVLGVNKSSSSKIKQFEDALELARFKLFEKSVSG